MFPHHISQSSHDGKPLDKNEFLQTFRPAMRYKWLFFSLSFLLPSLFGNEQFVCGGRIPFRQNLFVREDATTEMVDVPGLGVFAEYVCPSVANVRRQVPGTATVPKDQLQNILLQLQQMELTILSLINQNMVDGQLDSTDPGGVSVGENNAQVISISSPSPTSMDIASLSSVVSSILSATPAKSPNYSDPEACTYNISTTAFQSTVTITKTVATKISMLISVNVAANSTTMASAAAPSTTLSNAVASSTTMSAESIASSASLSGSAPSTLPGAIFAQSSSGSAAAPTSTGTAGQGTSQNSTTGYTFNAASSKNIAVYFSQTSVTGETTLEAQCADPNIDIAILAFVISNADGGQYPKINFGAACGGQTTEMISEAPGLLSCPDLATNITACQSTYGKKVMLSIGGATSQIEFSNASSASTFANTMWNLFGPPGNVDVGLRPFGTVEIDGFDVGS